MPGLMLEFNSDKEKETTVWHETEKYFIDLNMKKNFEKKVKIWLFHHKASKDLGDILQQQKLVLSSFDKLMNDRLFKLLLSAILHVGNICNAGDPKKGRADGFSYDAIHATFRTKTHNGDSMLKFICQKLKEEEPGVR